MSKRNSRKPEFRPGFAPSREERAKTIRECGTAAWMGRPCVFQGKTRKDKLEKIGRKEARSYLQ